MEEANNFSRELCRNEKGEITLGDVVLKVGDKIEVKTWDFDLMGYFYFEDEIVFGELINGYSKHPMKEGPKMLKKHYYDLPDDYNGFFGENARLISQNEVC